MVLFYYFKKLNVRLMTYDVRLGISYNIIRHTSYSYRYTCALQKITAHLNHSNFFISLPTEF